jgi:uncharacterized membrane protein YozB (DUF420 family)
MAVNFEAASAGRPPHFGAREGADRWIFVLVAALLVAVTLAGFLPTSIEKVAAVQGGQRPPFPLVLHVHAVLMGSWLLLLLAQASLVATGRRDLHRKLGVVSVALVPAIVIAGVALAQTTFEARWMLANSGELDVAATLRLKGQATGVLLNQIRLMAVFPILAGLAIAVRRTDLELHKRLMILATVVPVQAGIERMARQLDWPTTLPESPLSLDVQMLLPVLPLLAYELIRHRRIHRAYAIWLAVVLPPSIAFYLLLGTPWWYAMAPRLMGVG